MRLHKIRIEKISSFHLKKCAVNDCDVSSLLCTEVYHICMLYKS